MTGRCLIKSSSESCRQLKGSVEGQAGSLRAIGPNDTLCFSIQ